MKTWLYKHYDSERNLLYIGISCNPLARLAQHSFSSSWHDDIRHIEMAPFDSEEEAAEEENRLIGELRPPFNRLIIKDGKIFVFGLEERMRDEFESYRPRIQLEIENIGLAEFCRRSGVGRPVMDKLLAHEPGYFMKPISMKYLKRYFDRTLKNEPT